MSHVLLVDDDVNLRKIISFKLKQRGFSVTEADNGAHALEITQTETFDLVLTDMRMPMVDGIELLAELQQLNIDLPVIMITAHADISQAVAAIKMGAYDYLPKPFDDEQLYVTIDKALRFRKLESENRDLKKKLATRESEGFIVGLSPEFKALMAIVDKVAAADATVLITGESGTGKEVIARCIHRKSDRSGKAFISVNCAAIPADLLESEMFGHIKGSFTGAIKDKKGKFQLADGGTLFLDEISELPLELQPKLLRAIQEKVIEPVGSEKSIPVDIRVVTASNRDLKKKVAEKSFREDLFYRLNVVPLEIPPLRKRMNDIPIFIAGFLKKFSPKEQLKIDDNLSHTLSRLPYPGNIRELENLIERMVILRQSNTLTMADLPEEYRNTASEVVVSSATDDGLGLADAERKIIENALKKTGGNKSKAAKLLQIPRHILIYRIKKYNLE